MRLSNAIVTTPALARNSACGVNSSREPLPDPETNTIAGCRPGVSGTRNVPSRRWPSAGSEIASRRIGSAATTGFSSWVGCAGMDRKAASVLSGGGSNAGGSTYPTEARATSTRPAAMLKVPRPVRIGLPNCVGFR